MELREINTFLIAAEKMNFSKAADQLGYTQAAVSIQIKQLEKDLGTPLFERIGKNIYLTEKGRDFLTYAKKINHLKDDAIAHMRGQENHTGTIRIGTSASILSTHFSDIIQDFHTLYPRMKMQVKIGIREDLYDAMSKNNLDLAYIIDQNLIDHQWLGKITKQDSAVFVTSPNHPLNGKVDLTIDDILKENIILTETHVGYSYALIQLLAKENLTISPYLEVGDTEVIKKLVAQDHSISYLPQFTIMEEMKKNLLVPLRLPDYEVSVYRQVFWHNNKYLSKPMTDLIRLIEACDGNDK